MVGCTPNSLNGSQEALLVPSIPSVSGRGAAWKTYGIWSFWVGLAFFLVYPLCNYWASTRAATYGLYLPIELKIPFIPGFVWMYFSMYVLFLMPAFSLEPSALSKLGKRLVYGTFLSGLCFLLVPARLGFPREVPLGPLHGAMYRQVFSIDLPHNMAPSLHVVYSTQFLLALIRATDSTWQKSLWWVWLVLISVSTLLVHQHHVVDVVSGLGLAILLHHQIK